MASGVSVSSWAYRNFTKHLGFQCDSEEKVTKRKSNRIIRLAIIVKKNNMPPHATLAQVTLGAYTRKNGMFFLLTLLKVTQSYTHTRSLSLRLCYSRSHIARIQTKIHHHTHTHIHTFKSIIQLTT